MRLVFGGLILVFVLVGCKTSRVAKTSVKPEIKRIKAKRVIAKSFRNDTDFDFLNLNKVTYKVKIGDESQRTLRGNLKLVKDSLIIGSMQVGLGIEVARFYADFDSITVVNKLKKEVISFTYRNLKKKLGVRLSFFDLQDIICNDLFVYKYKMMRRPFNNAKIDYSDSYSIERVIYDYFIKAEEAFFRDIRRSEIKQNFVISSDFRTIKNSLSMPSESSSVELIYRLVDDSMMRYDKLDIKLANDKFKGDISFKINSVSDEYPRMRFKIPKKYKRIEF